MDRKMNIHAIISINSAAFQKKNKKALTGVVFTLFYYVLIFNDKVYGFYSGAFVAAMPSTISTRTS